MKGLFRERDFTLLLAGQTLTMFGDVCLFLVLGIWVKDLTGSNGAAGFTFLLLAAPGLVGPLAGVIVDRFPRRAVMIWNDAVMALVVISLLLVHDQGDVWIIYAVALAYGLSGQFFFAARSGLLVSMLPSEKLGEANGLLESLRQGLRIVGPLLGAALFVAWGGGVVAMVDSATFVVSVAFLSLMSPPDIARRESHPPFFGEVTAGIHHIRRTVQLRRLVISVVLALTTVGMLEAAFFALVEAVGKEPSFAGVLASFQGGGSVLGGFVSPSLLRLYGESRAVAAGLIGTGAGAGVIAIGSVGVAIGGSVVFGVFLSVLLVGYMTLLQRRTSDELQGRVFAAAEMVYAIPYALSIGLGAAIIDAVGFRPIYVANAAMLFATGLWLWLVSKTGTAEKGGASVPGLTVGDVRTEPFGAEVE